MSPRGRKPAADPLSHAVHFRLTTRIKGLLDDAAKADKRKPGDWVRVLVEETLERRFPKKGR